MTVRELRRAARARVVLGTKLGELGRQIRGEQLVDPHRAVEVLQGPRPEIAEVELAELLLVLEQGLGRLREEHLPPVCRRADARRPVDRETHVLVSRDRRLPCMDPDPDPQLSLLGPWMAGDGALRLHGGANRILRLPEGDEERVALRVDLVASGFLKGGAEQPLVVGHHVRVPVSELPHQLGRALDVREEKGDGAGRELGHHLPFTGMRARTWKPPPVRGPASSCPPATAMRSRSPTSP